MKNSEQLRHSALKKNKKEEGSIIFPKYLELDPKNQFEDVPIEYLEHECKDKKIDNQLLKICDDITQ
jgi:hypothetical protein